MIEAVKYNWLVRFLLVCLIPFCIIGPFIPRALLFDLLNPFSISIWIGFMIAYGDGWRALFTARAEITGGQLLRLALNGVAIYIIFRHSANWVSRELGEMDWIQNSFFVALLIFIISLAGVLALGAEKVIEGYIPPPYWRRIGIITAAALSVGSAVFALVRYLS